ncbi:MAG TPA: hypothetical protein VH370_00115 [Humisphaera sp.]|jgi:Arc/MetJ-type ribon-helix-helix transcriptional regulator|nr:hypothetical protein [Humisphaera sp.]
MQVQLTKPELEKYVTEKVRAGEFPSAEAVVEDALARVMHGEVVLTEEDRRAIAEADADFERGDVIDLDVFAADMRKRYRQIA